MQVFSEGFKVQYHLTKISSIGLRAAGEINGVQYPDAVKLVASIAYEQETEEDGITEKEQKITVIIPCENHEDMVTVKDHARTFRQNGVVVVVNGPIASVESGSNYKVTSFDTAEQFLENNGVKVKAGKKPVDNHQPANAG